MSSAACGEEARSHRHVPSAQIELLDTVALNLHRIDKDVQRCDRNYCYFTTANLEKLRNIMCRCESPNQHVRPIWDGRPHPSLLG